MALSARLAPLILRGGFWCCSKEDLLDKFSDTEPGDDAEGAAEHVVVVLLGEVTLTLALSRRGRGGSNPRWPGTEDLAETDDEGVPFLVGAQKGRRLNAFQEVH